jgi:hypothetical protein
MNIKTISVATEICKMSRSVLQSALPPFASSKRPLQRNTLDAAQKQRQHFLITAEYEKRWPYYLPNSEVDTWSFLSAAR